MNLSERHSEIKKILSQKNYATVEELSEALNVSKVTIRADLSALEQKGLLSRTHGGAMIAEVAPRLISQTLTEYEGEKNRIGNAALKLIENDAVIILDSGSTTIKVAEALGEREVTVVTNSLPVFDRVRDNKNIELLFLGGTFRRGYMACIGAITRLAISQIHADCYFMGGSGYTEDAIYCSNLVDAETKQTMMKAAERVCFMADSSKRGKTGFAHLTVWEEVDYFITDSIDDDFRAALESKGVEVFVAE